MMDSAPSNDEAAPPPEAPGERPSTMLAVLILAGIVAASTIIALLSAQTDQSSNPEGPNVQVQDTTIQGGAACPKLRTAAERFAADDQKGFVAAVEHAARIGEDTLQRSGVTFGRPERIALELAFLVDSDRRASAARLERVISAGIEACSSLEA